MAFTLSGGRPALVAYMGSSALVLPFNTDSVQLESVGDCDAAFDYLFERALDHHLWPLLDTIRPRIRVGTRLLWGNVAASASVAFRTMEGCLGPWVQELGERFFQICPSELKGLGSFLLLEHEGRRGWFWERTNCCLYDRLPGNIRCSDCSRTPQELRRAAYQDSLDNR
jgi:ferric iron reductase protein FhuF